MGSSQRKRKGKEEGTQHETKSAENKPWDSPEDPETETQEEVMTKDKASQASQEEVDPRDTSRSENGHEEGKTAN